MNKKQDESKKEELIEEADAEIEQLDEEPTVDNDEIDVITNQLKRALADYQNLEKRTQEAKRGWILAASQGLVVKLLPVLDDLLLAQKHIRDDGLNLSVQKFLNILKEEEAERIETKDQDFDPNTMECVSVQAGEENKVLEELRPGFIMDERVLRPAQVIVGGKQ